MLDAIEEGAGSQLNEREDPEQDFEKNALLPLSTDLPYTPTKNTNKSVRSNQSSSVDHA